MADFLTEKRAEMDKRLRELRPLHEEYIRLGRALEALGDVDGGRPAPTNGRARKPRAARPANGRRRRSRRSGTRAEQALAVVRKNPGITVSQLGDKLGITQKNYLYRVMNNLQAKGSVRKRGRGFSAV